MRVPVRDPAEMRGARSVASHSARVSAAPRSASSASFSLSLSACPADFAARQWWATFPDGSMTTVDRLTLARPFRWPARLP